MSTREVFHGPLAEVMADFVAFKHMQGYSYGSQVSQLRVFDRFLTGQDCPAGILRTEIVERYLATTAGIAPRTRENLLSVVREFSRYVHACRPESAVVPAGMLPRHCRNVRFYRIRPEQVRLLMDAALGLRMRHPVGPAAVRFLIGLLYATGLRIGEALKLRLGDIDPDLGTLFVRRGKFGKDRLVALTQSTLDALEVWLELRSRYAATGPSTPLLLGASNKGLTYDQVKPAFRDLCQRCELHGRPPPRLHDLRHNFACRCIANWHETGKDVQALLPVLANAMGHVNIFATQVYIHLDATDLQQASVKFRDHFIQQREL